jgi:uncharacterized Zn-binding protein involved in type VI secretion
MFATTTKGGLCMAFPDICKTPFPPGPPLPIPYPNIAQPQMADPVTKKVSIAGSPALTKRSKIKTSSGDEAGMAGGVASGTNMGQTEIISGSKTVKFEGSPAVRMGDQTKQNDGNAIGAVLAPGQTKVMIMS